MPTKTRRGRRRRRSPDDAVVHFGGDFFHRHPAPDYAAEALRSIDESLARRALTGVQVTGTTPVSDLRRYVAAVTLTDDLLGPAALLACDTGRYAALPATDLFAGWKAARDLPVLPEPLALAARLAGTFTGT